MSLPTCPKCGTQLEVRLIYAYGPKSSPISDDSGGNIGELLEVIDDSTLGGKSLEFITSVRERYARYGATTRMSDKQMNWLRQLAMQEDSHE